MHPLKDKACIVGIGETAYTRGTDRSVLNQMLRAAMAALDDAGLKPHDIDGIVTAMPLPTVEHLAANLGIPDLRYSASSKLAARPRSLPCRRARWQSRWAWPTPYSSPSGGMLFQAAVYAAPGAADPRVCRLRLG